MAQAQLAGDGQAEDAAADDCEVAGGRNRSGGGEGRGHPLLVVGSGPLVLSRPRAGRPRPGNDRRLMPEQLDDVGRVVVTGAGGFVGSAVARALAASGADVVAVTRPGGDPSRLPDGVERLELDLAEVDAAAVAIAGAGGDVCIHVAAAGAVVREPSRERLIRVNALFPHALARELARSGCRRLVTAGSSSEYGPVDGPMREELAAAPDDLYGATKLAGALMARAVGLEEGLETVHLRLFSVYGPGEDERRLIASVARALVEGRPIDLTEGEQVRDFVYVDDVAEAFLAAARAPGASGEIVNVGSGRQLSAREACLALAEAAGADPALLRFGAIPHRTPPVLSWQADRDPRAGGPRLAGADELRGGRSADRGSARRLEHRDRNLANRSRRPPHVVRRSVRPGVGVRSWGIARDVAAALNDPAPRLSRPSPKEGESLEHDDPDSHIE